jgi:hypothetical protein
MFLAIFAPIELASMERMTSWLEDARAARFIAA